MYNVVYDERVVKKDIPALSASVKRRIQHAIQQKLVIDPRTFGKPLRYSLKGVRVLRVGDFRVAFLLFRKEVRVLLIRHRSDIYKELQKRLP